jgi:uncharacterized protein YqjF (DUF2071 family)
MAMRWHDLLFAHWPIRPEAIRDAIPAALEVDTFDGWAWIGVVPFRMTGVRPRLTPAMRCVSDFAELNVRTYVRSPGRAGVWFYRLDAANRLAVRVARAWYGLPYYDARITCDADGEAIRYESVRTHAGGAPAAFEARYAPTGPVERAAPGTLEHWLVERYCLYAAGRRGRVGYGDIDHEPWPLQPAEAEIRANTMAEASGVVLPSAPPILHFARFLDVVAWSVVPLSRDETLV